MSNLLGLPKHEDVTEIDLGESRAAVVRLTAENRPHMVKLALSMYLGEHCKYCDREFETLVDLEDSVYAGYHDRGRLACQKCWDDNNPPEVNDS